MIKILLSLFLLIIIYQDFKHRAIWWPVLPMAFLLQLAMAIKSLGISEAFYNFILNLGIVCIQLSVLYAYFLIKHRSLRIPFFKQYLGLGDVLFFLVLAAAFAPFNFVLVLICLLIISLIAGLFLNHKSKTIPLAGIMAVCYMPLLWISQFNATFNPYIELINRYQ
ncbi:MAG: hypothetical protein WCX31_02265 [Salinivirgaceae bacterium]